MPVSAAGGLSSNSLISPQSSGCGGFVASIQTEHWLDHTKDWMLHCTDTYEGRESSRYYKFLLKGVINSGEPFHKPCEGNMDIIENGYKRELLRRVSQCLTFPLQQWPRNAGVATAGILAFYYWQGNCFTKRGFYWIYIDATIKMCHKTFYRFVATWSERTCMTSLASPTIRMIFWAHIVPVLQSLDCLVMSFFCFRIRSCRSCR